jgi:hypothetical protein
VVYRTIETMLDFAARHNITPQTEHMPMSQINKSFERLEAGKARYRSQRSDPAPLESHPTREAVEKVFAVRAVGNLTSTLHSFSASYLSRWLPGIVIDIDSQVDETGAFRVIRLGFRFKTKEDFFLPIRSFR